MLQGGYHKLSQAACLIIHEHLANYHTQHRPFCMIVKEECEHNLKSRVNELLVCFRSCFLFVCFLFFKSFFFLAR